MIQFDKQFFFKWVGSTTIKVFVKNRELEEWMAKEENRKSFTPKILPFLWYIYVLQKR